MHGTGDVSQAFGIDSSHDWVVVTVTLTVRELKVVCAVSES